MYAGKDIYIDVNGWHLFLRDASAGKGLKLSQALGQQLGSEVSAGKLRPDDIEQILKKVPIKLGAGKTTVSLFEVLPSASVADLQRILERFAKDN